MRESPSQDENVEENTGIECPGNKSLEVYIGSLMTLEDSQFLEECILVEVSERQFAYKYTKQDRAFIGKCEWCMKKRELKIICKCRRVRYCD